MSTEKLFFRYNRKIKNTNNATMTHYYYDYWSYRKS